MFYQSERETFSPVNSLPVYMYSPGTQLGQCVVMPETLLICPQKRSIKVTLRMVLAALTLLKLRPCPIIPNLILVTASPKDITSNGES